MAKQQTLSAEDTNVALPNRVTIEQQVAILAEIGITVNEGVTIDDLTAFEDRDELELQPYARLVEALGSEIEREPFTPMCNRLWMCDYERIEDHGDYQAVIERLEIMTDCALGLRDIKDYERAFGQQLARDPESSGSERQSNPHLFPPGGGARQQQPGDIRAGDQRNTTRAIEFRRDADDGEGIRIQADRFADDRLRAELLAPQAFADDRHRIRAFDNGFGRLQQSSLRGSYAEYIEVIARTSAPMTRSALPSVLR